MKLETFFEKFDELAGTRNGVPRVRRLILDLAVRGRLVPRTPKDGPAEISLPKLAAEAIEAEEDGFPSHWLRVPLGKTGEWRGGGTPSKSDPDYWTGYLPWVSPKDMTALHISDSQDHITQAAVAGSTVKLIPPGSLLMVVRGMILARAFPVALTTREVTINQDMKALLPCEPSIKDFLLVALRAFEPAVLAAIERTSHGTCKLRTELLQDLVIPFPPLAEQKRIVAKVDELMALCDRLEAQQKEREARHAALARASLSRFADAPTPSNLNLLFHKSYDIAPADLRKTILTLALQGKLVPQDPNDEPAETLLRVLETERQSFASTSRYRSPPAESVDKATVPFEIPGTWKWCRLSSLFIAVTDGDHLPPPKSDSGVAFLTIGNITTGRLDFDGARFVPKIYYEGLAEFRRPKRGDILYTVVGATFGRPALVETDRPFCVQRHIAILKPPQAMEVGYLMSVLRAPLAYEQAKRGTTGTAQPTVPLSSLRNFAVPLPPLAEQRRIVAKVEQLMTLVDALEKQLAASRATAANLLSALVAELTSPG